MIEKLGLFNEKVKVMKIGSDIHAYITEWDSIVEAHDMSIVVLYDDRKNLDDHCLDMKAERKVVNRNNRTTRDKTRQQYYLGQTPKAVAFEVVCISNQLGQNSGLAGDEIGDEDLVVLSSYVTRPLSHSNHVCSLVCACFIYL